MRKTPENMEKLWDTVQAWIDEQQPSCPESIYQCDWFAESSLDLAEKVCDIVGYADAEPES